MSTIQSCGREILKSLFLILTREILLDTFLETTVKAIRLGWHQLWWTIGLNRDKDSRLWTQSKEIKHNLLTACQSSIYTSRSWKWRRKREMIQLNWRQSKISEELEKTPDWRLTSRSNSAKGMTSRFKLLKVGTLRVLPSNSTSIQPDRPLIHVARIKESQILRETQTSTVRKSRCRTHILGSTHKHIIKGPKASHSQRALSKSGYRPSIWDHQRNGWCEGLCRAKKHSMDKTIRQQI